MVIAEKKLCLKHLELLKNKGNLQYNILDKKEGLTHEVEVDDLLYKHCFKFCKKKKFYIAIYINVPSKTIRMLHIKEETISCNVSTLLKTDNEHKELQLEVFTHIKCNVMI